MEVEKIPSQAPSDAGVRSSQWQQMLSMTSTTQFQNYCRDEWEGDSVDAFPRRGVLSGTWRPNDTNSICFYY